MRAWLNPHAQWVVRVEPGSHIAGLPCFNPRATHRARFSLECVRSMGALLVRVGVERNVAVSFLNENGPGLAHIQGPVDGNDKSLSEA